MNRHTILVISVIFLGACGSNIGGGRASTALQSPSSATVGGGSTTGGSCGADSNTPATLTPARYQYAFFRRDDWTTPVGTRQSDLYVIIASDPNFCSLDANRGILTNATVNPNVPTLSVSYSFVGDSNNDPIVINPNTYTTSVLVDADQPETSPYEVLENPNTPVCDLYGGIANGGGVASGAFAIQSLDANTLTFTLNATMDSYQAPSGQPAVFSGQTLQYALQAQACAFQPKDLTHGLPNAPPAVPVAQCPLQ